MRGDDGAGPFLIQRLQEEITPLPEDWLLINAGEVPENYLNRIIDFRPAQVLLIDATDFQAPAGSLKMFKFSDLRGAGFSTHNASLKIVMDFLERETRAEVRLLGIQPQRTDLGAEISEPVRNAVEEILQLLLKGISHA